MSLAILEMVIVTTKITMRAAILMEVIVVYMSSMQIIVPNVYVMKIYS